MHSVSQLEHFEDDSFYFFSGEVTIDVPQEIPQTQAHRGWISSPQMR